MNEALSEAAKADRRKLRGALAKAHTLFLDRLETAPAPADFPLPYGMCKAVAEAEWTRIWLAEHIVADELQETINQLNAWREWLHHLTIWTEVIKHFDEDDAWEMQHYYVDPLAYICLMQPSSVRDRFGHIATNAVHQANLNCDDSYKDRLDQDETERPLGRTRCEKQLRRIGQRWGKAEPYLRALSTLDSEGYRQGTLNFRNRASHAIAPRFRFGVTNFVTRSIGPRINMALQPDGTYLENKSLTEKSVSYGFGGTPALDLHDIVRLSTNEYSKAAATFYAYQGLLEEILAELRKKHPTEASPNWRRHFSAYNFTPPADHPVAPPARTARASGRC